MNNYQKKPENNKQRTPNKKDERTYSYYSRVLKEPFDSVGELKEAEEAYYAKLKAKEDKAAQKKTDALKVEDAFKALNKARKDFKTKLTALTEAYREELESLKKSFENAKADIHKELSEHEDAYSNALKTFTEKYPEGFHLTLKDGDFETTIGHQTSGKPLSNFTDLFDFFFGF